MKERPLFIVIEGVDGSGKTTQINLLKQRFAAHNLSAVETHEPSDGVVGRLIRDIMRGNTPATQSTLAALFLADRLEHINNPVHGMKALMAKGHHIICSRYYFSNYAFQSEYVPIEWLVQCNSICKQELQPDLIIYLNIDPAASNERVQKGREHIEIFENLEKTIKAHEAFLAAFKQYVSDENIHIINAHQNITEIGNEIWRLVEAAL
jgi:dTMP kinase